MLATPAEDAIAGQLSNDALAKTLSNEVLTGRMINDMVAGLPSSSPGQPGNRGGTSPR